MRLAALLLASLAASAPALAIAQGMDVPTAPPAAPPPVEPAAQPAAAAPPATPAGTANAAVAPQKSGPYVGFSVITGKGTAYYPDGSSQDVNDALRLAGAVLGDPNTSPATLGLMLRLGWGTGDLLFGGQFNWIRSFISVGGTEAGYDFRAFDLTATWWSQEMGIYGRVGVGPAQYRTYAGSSESDPASGVEVMAGFGVTMGGLGVGIDFMRQGYDAKETGFDSVMYLSGGLSLDLY